MQRLQSTAVLQPITQSPLSPITRLFFFNTQLAWFWVIVRLYIGYQWLTAGWVKMTGYSIAFGTFGKAAKGGSWLVAGHGTNVLQTFFTHSITLAGGDNPTVQNWYGAFLQHVALPSVSVFAYLIPLGETLVGVALIIGIFTGIAAGFGALMNMNYLLAGAVSINPVMLLLQIFLILAWRVCGFYGVDKFLLPWLNTQRSQVLAKNAAPDVISINRDSMLS